ncbi:hypothetical protein [Yinghuangia soli]|uniref:Uncharacterized protein n=1 Tax=Yinghuangia soli TaxID=2908204 RepID=A0AA41PWD6_9ACTN|nr:hypothetical protein [Yinghuangia soli]MCF2526961.1 hypothetical protein [Yinghuangia soli]
MGVVETLLLRPFAERPYRAGEASGGPGWHMVDLEVSRDFWEDSERDQIEVVWDQYEDKARRLAGVLDGRHGAHRVVALAPYFERGMEGEDVPEPFDDLSNFVVRLHVWTIGDRWLGVGVGQYDKELPIQLVAVTGAGPGPGAEPGTRAATGSENAGQG